MAARWAQVQYTVAPTTFTSSQTEKIELLSSIRARLGWLPIDSVLLYGTAGLGWEHLGSTYGFSSVAPAGSLTASTYSAADRFGWVAGAGAETMLPGGNWIGRLEYLHYGFGVTVASGAITNRDGTSAFQAGNHGVDVLRAGLSYKFGDPAAATPVRYAKAPLLAPPSSWAGFYLGAHAGHGWNDDDFTQLVDSTGGAQAGGIQSRGWVAGGHAGYNWQYGRVVAGLEADLSFAGIQGTSRPVTHLDFEFGTAFLTDTLADRIKYLATARTRLGWVPTDSVLLYATAGPAWERMERTSTRTDQDTFFFRTSVLTNPTDRFGGVVGAGTEWMPFGPNWIGRVEYLHYDFGKVRNTTTFVTNLPGNMSFSEHRGRQTIEIVRAGVSYKFQ